VGWRNQGPKKVAAVLVARTLEFVFRIISRKTLTFTVGREIYNAYARSSRSVHEIAVSLVSEGDIMRGISTKIDRKRQRIRLLSVGRLALEKGVIHLIRAVGDLVANENTEISLDVVGEGEEEEGLRREVMRLGLNEYVNFWGYMDYGDKLLSMYRTCDIYILPSLTEGWPQTLFEAMACGVPVIATRVGGIPHLIDDGNNGLLVNPGSSCEISNAVRRLMNDCELRRRLVKNGFDTVTNHTLDVERRRMIRHIKQFVKKSSLQCMKRSCGHAICDS
jgi:glycosyltransferase involved in cell wall biosynthesis